MVRLESARKPLPSAADPTQSAKLAAIKQSLSARDSRFLMPAQPTLTTPEILSLTARLTQHDLRIAINQLIATNAGARESLTAFFMTKQGAATRPYDFAAVLAQCKVAIEEFEEPEWEQATSHHDFEADREAIVDNVTGAINSAILKARKISIRSTSSQETKVSGITTLIDIADLVKKARDLDRTDESCENRQPELLKTAFEAVNAIVQTIPQEDQSQLKLKADYRAMMHRYGKLEALVARLFDDLEHEDE